jgi:hypothetical protein
VLGKGQHHAVNAWWRDAKEELHVRLRWWLPMNESVHPYEGQVLALQGGELGLVSQLSVPFSEKGVPLDQRRLGGSRGIHRVARISEVTGGDVGEARLVAG